MANKLYRKNHEGREFVQLETFNRAIFRVVIVHQIDRQTVSRAKWNEELAKAVEAENAAAECNALTPERNMSGTMTPTQEKAFWEGAAAARNFAPLTDNPYTKVDPEQRAGWWFHGHKAVRDAKARILRKARSYRLA